MKITVTRNDNKVYVDGIARDVDCSELPEFVHAIQFENDVGHVEFKTDSKGRRMGNLKTMDLTFVQFLLDRYKIEDDRVRKHEADLEKTKEQMKEEHEAALKKLMHEKIK